jgi:hypothetical protein
MQATVLRQLLKQPRLQLKNKGTVFSGGPSKQVLRVTAKFFWTGVYFSSVQSGVINLLKNIVVVEELANKCFS